MQTRLICHYNGKWPISLTDVSKLLMTLITPILLPKLSVLILLSRVLNSSSWRIHTKKEFDSFIKALKFFSVPFQVTIKMKIQISKLTASLKGKKNGTPPTLRGEQCEKGIQTHPRNRKSTNEDGVPIFCPAQGPADISTILYTWTPPHSLCWLWTVCAMSRQLESLDQLFSPNAEISEYTLSVSYVQPRPSIKFNFTTKVLRRCFACLVLWQSW